MNINNILAIDAGNTRVKWGLFNSKGEMLDCGACVNADLALATFPAAARIVISNVAGNVIELQLKSLFQRSNNIHWIKSQSNACGVRNLYDQPELLGTDRWASLIAAWHIKRAPCVVVNAGTAVTIDALSVSQDEDNNFQAKFIGGLILPGLNLMQQSLGLGTAQLPKKNLIKTTQTSTVIFATNTADAIFSGTLHAVLGAISLMSNELNNYCKQVPYILISGGNSNVIKENIFVEMTKQVLIVDNLVLQGLYLLENFMKSDVE